MAVGLALASLRHLDEFAPAGSADNWAAMRAADQDALSAGLASIAVRIGAVE